MKRPLRTALLALLGLLAAACARHTIIPDETLAMIFRDAFLSNAYISEERIPTDSLRIYEPIFARLRLYDRRRTIRSAIVERAIDLLEAEGKVYNRRVAILDTIDNVACRTFTRTVFADSLLRVGSLRDTARLTFSIDVEPGEYRITAHYLIDSLDRNRRGVKATVWLEKEDGSRAGVYTTSLRRNREETFTRTLTADTVHRRLHVDLLGFYGRPERPSMTVSRIRIDHTPPAADAVERLYDSQLNVRIFADEFFRAAMPADSL